MERPNFEDEDSNHSVNGWIKKEIEDEDFEEYMKQEQDDEHGGERYEELMNLSKEDLVGRILQQEEDIRYLQDIRHGLEKNIQGFTASCAHFKKLLEVMSSHISSLKDCQSAATVGTLRHTGGATSMPSSSRPTTSAPTTQASPRSTPSVPTCTSTTTASPRSTPNIPASTSNTRSSANSSNLSSSHMAASNVSNDRLHTSASMSSHQTVTITRQTNVIIKTEIPSPPPEPMITSTPMSCPSIASSSMPHVNQKSRSEAAPYYQVRQQQAASSVKSYVPNSSRSITEIANSIPSYRQRTKGNPNMSFPSNVSAAQKMGNQPNKNNMQQQFNMQRQQSAVSSPGNFTGGRGRGRASVSHRNVPYSTQKPPINTSCVTTMAGRPRATAAISNVSSSSSSSSGGGSAVNDILANISLKVPSGITLSIVSPRTTPETRTQQSTADKSAASANTNVRTAPAETNSRANASQSLHSSNTATAEEGNISKSSAEKGVSSSGGTNPSFSTTNTISDVTGSYAEEDDDDGDDYFDEIAVLIPDKKSSPGLEGSGTPTDNVTSNAVMTSDVHAKSQSRANESFWNSQGSGQKANQAVYQNNAEYMFEEPEDIDSDENDAKVYLGENVTLPRELVDSCIKQGSTPTKLTRNLMKALFPDIRELASGCAEGDTSRPAQPLLPGNKVKAIVALVQKTFPQAKRSAIILTMNMKCKEARVLLNRSGTQQYSF